DRALRMVGDEFSLLFGPVRPPKPTKRVEGLKRFFRRRTVRHRKWPPAGARDDLDDMARRIEDDQPAWLRTRHGGWSVHPRRAHQHPAADESLRGGVRSS